MTPATFARVLLEAARGRFPEADGRVDLVTEPVGPAHAVVAFSAHFVVCAPVARSWLDDILDPADFTATHHPHFLASLAARLGADIGALDVVLASSQPPGEAQAAPLALHEVGERDHPRVRRAMRYRDDVRVWRNADGTGQLVVGRGLAGRREAAFEVDPRARGRGVGRRLARAARSMATADDPVWTQVSPGNVASLRAVLAAGYAPVCSEVLLPPSSPGQPT